MSCERRIAQARARVYKKMQWRIKGGFGDAPFLPEHKFFEEKMANFELKIPPRRRLEPFSFGGRPPSQNHKYANENMQMR